MFKISVLLKTYIFNSKFNYVFKNAGLILKTVGKVRTLKTVGRVRTVRTLTTVKTVRAVRTVGKVIELFVTVRIIILLA